MEQAVERKDELVQKLKQFDTEHDFWLKSIRHAIGRLVMRVGGNPVSRWMIANVTTRILAFLVVRFRALGIEKGKDALDIAYNWQKLAAFLRIPLEVESASSERVVLVHHECTMGLEPCERANKVCRSTMNMDKALIKRLDGKISVLSTIAGGAGECRYIIEKLGGEKPA